jgi:hypothetical protein
MLRERLLALFASTGLLGLAVLLGTGLQLGVGGLFGFLL